MKTYTTIKTLVFSAIVALTFTSCVKDDDWNTPEVLCNNRFDMPTTTMAEFVALTPKPERVTDYSGPTYKIPVDGPAVIFDAYVVSSDENGNFYKTISFQDSPSNPTVGLQMEVDKASNYADFPVGAHIRIKANGLVLALDRGTIKIGSVDPTYAIGRIPSILLTRYLAGVCKDNRLDIAEMVPTKLATLKEAADAKYINTLVQISDVQFKMTDVNNPPSYIDYRLGTGLDTNREIEAKNGYTTIIRNSGFSTFGANKLPVNSGDITFVVSKYNGDFQMLIRSTSDVKFTRDRFVTGGSSDEEATNLLFPGADFENWTTFLNSLNSFGLTSGSAIHGLGMGRDNSNSLFLNGTYSSNIFVFTAKAGLSSVPATPKKITFWVKGTAGKSLSMNVETTDGRIFFNLGALDEKGKILVPQENNQYSGIIDTKGEWRLVTLDLTGKILKTTGDLFAIKAGSNTKFDVHIDNIKID